jgi:uncharacterized membrane protein
MPATSPESLLGSKTMSFCFPVRLAPPVSAAPPLLAKTFLAIPPASAAILAPVSSAHSVVDAIAAAVAARTAVAAVPIAAQIVVQIVVQTVVQTAHDLPARDSNAVPAAPVVLGTIAVTAATPVRRAARS